MASASGFPPREILDALAAVMVVTTLASGADYVTRFLRRAFAQMAAA
jgi:hypothetical protein